jgi:hypothetical protein
MEKNEHKLPDIFEALFVRLQGRIRRSTPEHNPAKTLKKLQSSKWRVTGYELTDTRVKEKIEEGKLGGFRGETKDEYITRMIHSYKRFANQHPGTKSTKQYESDFTKENEKEMETRRAWLRENHTLLCKLNGENHDANGNPVNIGTVKEWEVAELAEKWIDMEQELRDLYNDDRCIYAKGRAKGKCPQIGEHYNILRCSICAPIPTK